MSPVSDMVVSMAALHERSGGGGGEPDEKRPPVYKAIGISLAISSGVFIGISFVLKKYGLLKANVRYNEEAGEGYGYLKNLYWWGGMTLMIIGEICNFAAYAFIDAILVTPLGALSVVITTILSAIFLKERLSFVGKIGCLNCILGSVIIAINAPEQAAADSIEDMQAFFISPGFLSYAGVVIVTCAFVAFWAGPRYGKKTMLVYLTICSLVGGLSVVATQGIGAAIVKQARGTPQFNQWFLYVLLVFVLATLLVEIIYLNKALNIFNAALVTPTYYVYFTSATIVSSAILFRGFKGSPSSIATVVMGFLQICTGVILLQLSKSAKDVPDAAVFSGDLDQVRTVAEQEEPESEPKADAIRGTAALIRRISSSRLKMEAEEAKKIHEERLKDLEPIQEGEQFEWDGLRRRRTTRGDQELNGSLRRKTPHPPLGLTRFPDEDDEAPEEGRSPGDPDDGSDESGFIGSFRRRARSVWSNGQGSVSRSRGRSSTRPVPLTEIDGTPAEQAGYVPANSRFAEDTSYEQSHSSFLRPPPSPGDSVRWATDVGSDRGQSRGTTGSSSIRPVPAQPAKRQFSFQNIFSRHSDKDSAPSSQHEGKLDARRTGLGSRQSSTGGGIAGVTEEERLGLVQGEGDKAELPPLREQASSAIDDAEEDDWQIEEKPRMLSSGSSSDGDGTPRNLMDEKEMEVYEEKRRRWRTSREAAKQATPGGRESPPDRGTTTGRRPDPDDDARRGGGSSKAAGHAFL
ncbi:MAG: hypothetical protein M1837_000259 [Sclerophora amabilis]|nr:MAG: hypothetical protein M1837_000259 [Sclerophora amabilis]